MIRIGVIGAGQIAETHAGNLINIEGVILKGVVDTSFDRAADFAEKFGCSAYHSIESLISDCNAVYICTPPQHHRDASILAARAGVHVFCEKPLAANVGDALAIERAVQNSNITFMVGFNMRYSPAFPHIRQLIGGDTLGDVHSFWGVRVLWLPHLPPNWRTDPRFICGMTIESLSHDFDVLRWMVGDVVDVTGKVSSTRPDLNGYDNVMSAILSLKAGGMASFHSSWASHVNFSQYGVIGTKGSITFDWDKLRIKTDLDSTERLIEFNSVQDRVESHKRETEQFIHCLKTGDLPLATVHDGVATVLISTAVLRSSDLKRTVEISELTS